MKYSLFAFFIVLFISCSNDSDNSINRDFTAENEQEILKYIADNGLMAQKSDSGLYYVIDEPGTGRHPNENSNVSVGYKGFFTNGDVFDQSDSNGISINLQSVIAGWTEGIPLFKEGGSGTLLIPSRLGYGNSTVGGIPPGSVLVFEVSLISVN